ncbi:hypothetical protein JCM8547_007821 [Rhodosporidiobolus lusitaniae]
MYGTRPRPKPTVSTSECRAYHRAGGGAAFHDRGVAQESSGAGKGWGTGMRANDGQLPPVDPSELMGNQADQDEVDATMSSTRALKLAIKQKVNGHKNPTSSATSSSWSANPPIAQAGSRAAASSSWRDPPPAGPAQSASGQERKPQPPHLAANPSSSPHAPADPTPSTSSSAGLAQPPTLRTDLSKATPPKREEKPSVSPFATQPKTEGVQISPTGNWAQGRSDFSSHKKFTAPPTNNKGYYADPSYVPPPPRSFRSGSSSPAASSSWGGQLRQTSAFVSRPTPQGALPAAGGSAGRGGGSPAPTRNGTHTSRWATPPPTAQNARPAAASPAVAASTSANPLLPSAAPAPNPPSSASSLAPPVPVVAAPASTTPLSTRPPPSTAAAPPFSSTTAPPPASSAPLPSSASPVPDSLIATISGTPADQARWQKEKDDLSSVQKKHDESSARSGKTMEKVGGRNEERRRRVQSTPARTTTPRTEQQQSRLASGGVQRAKKTPEELDALMAAMKIKNESCQKRLAAIEADRLAAEKVVHSERQRSAELEAEVQAERERIKKEGEEKRERTRELQCEIDAERARSAALKLSRIQGRAWDAEKLSPSSPAPSTPGTPLRLSAAPSRASTPSQYPSVERDARDAARRREEEEKRRNERVVSEEEAQETRVRDGVRGWDGPWESVEHHEGEGRATLIER